MLQTDVNNLEYLGTKLYCTCTMYCTMSHLDLLVAVGAPHPELLGLTLLLLLLAPPSHRHAAPPTVRLAADAGDHVLCRTCHICHDSRVTCRVLPRVQGLAAPHLRAVPVHLLLARRPAHYGALTLVFLFSGTKNILLERWRF